MDLGGFLDFQASKLGPGSIFLDGMVPSGSNFEHPGHLEGTNMDEKDMPNPFQALPEAKTSLKHRNMIDFKVKIKSKFC